MRKVNKLLMMSLFTLGLLAGCSNKQVHTVEFYAHSKGEFYMAIAVNHKEKVKRPVMPTAPINFTFDDWWVDQAFSAKFDFDKPIKKDTMIFAKWKENRVYVPDERVFHVVGETNNPDLNYINWNDVGEEGVAYDERSYLTKDEYTNLYSIELALGAEAKFKVKVAGAAWGSDTEFNFNHIDVSDRNEYIAEADYGNIQVLEDGLYKIEIETTFMWAKVVRVGDMLQSNRQHQTKTH